MNYNKHFNMTVEDLVAGRSYAVRIANCLQFANRDSPIIYVGQLVTLTERQVAKTMNMGPKSMAVINKALVDHGLTFEMDTAEWLKKNKLTSFAEAKTATKIEQFRQEFEDGIRKINQKVLFVERYPDEEASGAKYRGRYKLPSVESMWQGFLMAKDSTLMRTE